ncbi:exopolysaccharide biosynthesis polyprenyl glycosylphosphotransferase [uncultured Eubacterium sp.]|uniref:exopolysaccharide biosynthesis polyprenyl glycosylphosphotransferase n=1 Tax=uncultured Eubacterium sp. TaxID=165185 RepID=UPI0026730D53|nr:exopolysaccharide biosynthesis polyprenyl glycosylphosphotransferase [uncultured Eubacterium sp.]
MRKSRAFRRIMFLLLLALVIIAQTMIFWYFWNHYYSQGMSREFFFKGHIVLLFVYALMFTIFSNVYGAFKLGSLQYSNLVFSQILALFFTNLIMYLQISMLTLELVNPAPIIGMSFDNLLCCLIWCGLAMGTYKWMYPPKDMLLIYSDRDPDNLVNKIETRKDKYIIKDSIHCDEDSEKLQEAILNHQAVLLCDIPSGQRNQIVKDCYMHDKRAYITPKLSDIIITGANQNTLFDSPLLVTKNKGLKWEQAFVKRFMDIIIALILCIPTIVVTLLVAIGNLIWDRGPIFYTQPRLTKDGKVFKILKFRSMKVNSEKDGARLAAKNDNRITKVGRVLRATHLDELPQVFNILVGQMSVVGPRPERPEIAAEYEQEIPEFRFRLKVKAGLTGYAQVYGKYNTTPYDKLKLDMYYIQHYKMWTDVQLILMTFKIMFMKDNTEGVNADQKTAIIEKK